MNDTNIVNALGALLQQQAQTYEAKLQILVEKLVNVGMVNMEPHRERSIPKLNIPDFHGRPAEDINNWLFIVRQNLEAACISISRKTLVASGYLRDSALQWYRRRIQELGELTYEEFEEGLKSMFLPHNYQEVLRTKLDNVKQRGRLDEYINEFMNIMNQIMEMSEVDKIHAFKRGLAAKTRAEIGYVAPKSLQEAIEKAQGYDSNYFAEHAWKNSYHQMDVSFSKSTEEKRLKHCKFCKRRGHEISECFKKKAKANHSHSNKNNDEFVKVIAEVNKVPINCLVDTGANQSVISPETARKCGIPVIPSRITVTMADGTTIKPRGITSKTPINYKGLAN